MEKCLVVLATTHPLTECNTCSSCQLENGSWGMQFDCFDGSVTTNGACFDDLRVGLHPFDKPAVEKAPEESNDVKLLLIVAIVAFVLGGLFEKMLSCITRKRERQAEPGEGVFKTNGDGEVDETMGETESGPCPIEKADHSIQ